VEGFLLALFFGTLMNKLDLKEWLNIGLDLKTNSLEQG
jgi:hypothetical protein